MLSAPVSVGETFVYKKSDAHPAVVAPENPQMPNTVKTVSLKLTFSPDGPGKFDCGPLGLFEKEFDQIFEQQNLLRPSEIMRGAYVLRELYKTGEVIITDAYGLISKAGKPFSLSAYMAGQDGTLTEQ